MVINVLWISLSEFLYKQQKKWRNKIGSINQIIVAGKKRIPKCDSQKDRKQTFIKSISRPSGSNNRISARINFLTGKGKNKKYLGVVLK